jgi:flagellar biosynthetic protein FlhB
MPTVPSENYPQGRLMSEENSQERTEQATPKRAKETRDKGQVSRSRDLGTLITLLVSSIALSIYGGALVNSFSELMTSLYTFSWADFSQDDFVLKKLQIAFELILLPLSAILIIIFISHFISPLLIGGVSVNFKSISVKFSKLNPAKGLKKIISPNALVELAKSWLKLLVIGIICTVVIYYKFPDLENLSRLPLNIAMHSSLLVLIESLTLFSASLIIIAAIDVPWQWWQHQKQIRMTKQEVKDEHKESEGRPEQKSHIRRKQHEIAQRRMMEEIPKADVILTNPTHFAVAIRYDKTKRGAPRVIAKGVDLIALKIQAIAKQHKVTIVNVPPLARSVYYNTKLFHEIPQGLYVAVAQVLAYVYQLKRYQIGQSDKPGTLPELEIPDELKHE